MTQIETRVQVAKCPTCNGPMKLAVMEMMDKDSTKEFAKLMKKGFIIDTISLDEARSATMCFDKNHWK